MNYLCVITPRLPKLFFKLKVDYCEISMRSLRGSQIARFLPLETSVPFPRTSASSVLYDVYDMRLGSLPEAPLPIPSPFRVGILAAVAAT